MTKKTETIDDRNTDVTLFSHAQTCASLYYTRKGSFTANDSDGDWVAIFLFLIMLYSVAQNHWNTLRLLLLRRSQSLDVNFLCAQTFIKMQMILTAENLKPCSHLRFTRTIKNIWSAAGENIDANSAIHKAAGLPAAGVYALQRPFSHSWLSEFFRSTGIVPGKAGVKWALAPPPLP